MGISCNRLHLKPGKRNATDVMCKGHLAEGNLVIPLLNTFLLLLFLQEWETKAGEAKRQYDKAKKEYAESGGGSTSTSKK